jgi:hypothetical protein
LRNEPNVRRRGAFKLRPYGNDINNLLSYSTAANVPVVFGWEFGDGCRAAKVEFCDLHHLNRGKAAAD